MTCNNPDRHCEQLLTPGGSPYCRCEERRLRVRYDAVRVLLTGFTCLRYNAMGGQCVPESRCQACQVVEAALSESHS